MKKKDKRWKSKAYLRFVQARPCCHCGNPPPSDAHHWHPTEKGTGRKPSDCWTVPLCRACHEEYHQGHALSGLDALETRLRLIYVQWETMGAWIKNRHALTAIERYEPF